MTYYYELTVELFSISGLYVLYVNDIYFFLSALYKGSTLFHFAPKFNASYIQGNIPLTRLSDNQRSLPML